MPFNWTDNTVRDMLLYTIVNADLKPTTATWEIVAKKLGGGLNANAVSQKFYKLKRESEKLTGSESATPAMKTSAKKTPGIGGRKPNTDPDETPSKRPKKKAQEPSDRKEDEYETVKKDETSQKFVVKVEQAH